MEERRIEWQIRDFLSAIVTMVSAGRERGSTRRIGGKSEFEKCAQLKMERKVRPIKRPRKKSFQASFEFLGYSRILSCLYVGKLRMTVGG